MKHILKNRLATFAFAMLLAGISSAQTVQFRKSDSLYTGFLTPGNSARPRVWWHWVSGNISKDGIRKDLLWMQRIGIGGFQNFDAAVLSPQVVDKPVTYMSKEWKDAFKYATRLADSLKLEMAIAGSPGWSESGGPWVEPKDGMKKLVWSELRITGGTAFKSALPPPPGITGSFQNLPFKESSVLSPKTSPPPQYYQDVAVIAYRLPSSDISFTAMAPKVSSSSGSFTLQQLTDGDLETTNMLPRDTAKTYGFIQFEFGKPQVIRAITLAAGGVKESFGIVETADTRTLEASDDGINFWKVTSIPLGGVIQQTVSFPATKAKYFRVTFQNPVAPPAAGGIGRRRAPAGTNIAEIILHASAKVNHAEEKAGFAAAYDLEKYPSLATDASIAEKDIIDLTKKVGKDGQLNWVPPVGNWKIIRFGYSLTGKRNHPASEEATGLEVDKMDSRAVRDYFTTYLDKYTEATGGLIGKRGVSYMVTDSYESGQATWTPKMADEFRKRRGYSLLPWMPVLTGEVVRSAEASDKFLWDWRKTIGELITENHYDQLTGILNEKGMQRYSESHENGRVFVVDGMDVKRTAAIPMSAMWVPAGFGSTVAMAQADIRESASVAHIYGQNLVAAESMTVVGMANNAWGYHPANLKPTVDMELSQGVNRIVVHTSVHQPVDNKLPGLGLGPIGQWFNRHDAWAEQAKAWTDYISRSSYLLQQGKFVADIVYYYGEDNNITALFGGKLPAIPKGYNYDFINPHALLNLLTVDQGKLVTPSGMRYEVLVLDSNVKRMSLPVLRKIAKLAAEGAVIAGAKPEVPASLTDDTAEFRKLIAEVWESGKTNVRSGTELKELLNSAAIIPDFQSSQEKGAPELLFVHRKTAESDIFWVNSRSNKWENVEVKFRVMNKIPEIWHPETGRTEKVSYRMEGGATTVPLRLSPDDAVFVVFKDATAQLNLTVPEKNERLVQAIEGTWSVTFQPNRGAPATAAFEKLVSYTENSNVGIKYFSGTADYNKTIKILGKDIDKNAQLMIDLGEVGNLAEVLINGKSLGLVWKKPFRVDVTEALKPGVNKVEIKVTNVWSNRLIGDKQADVKDPITFTSFPYYNANSPLQPAGLLGPVKVVSIK